MRALRGYVRIPANSGYRMRAGGMATTIRPSGERNVGTRELGGTVRHEIPGG